MNGIFGFIFAVLGFFAVGFLAAGALFFTIRYFGRLDRKNQKNDKHPPTAAEA